MDICIYVHACCFIFRHQKPILTHTHSIIKMEEEEEEKSFSHFDTKSKKLLFGVSATNNGFLSALFCFRLSFGI